MSKKQPKFRYRYYVESVYGEMTTHLQAGDVIMEDRYHGRHHSPILVDLTTGREKGGYAATYLSRVLREERAQ